MEVVDESDTGLGSGGMCTSSHALMEDILKCKANTVIAEEILADMRTVDELLQRSEIPIVV